MTRSGLEWKRTSLLVVWSSFERKMRVSNVETEDPDDMRMLDPDDAGPDADEWGHPLGRGVYFWLPMPLCWHWQDGCRSRKHVKWVLL